MKLDLLRDVASMVAGKNAGSIVDLLFDKKNVNEFIIAKKLGLTINQTRNILYKLSDEGLVSFVRKKDKKKGWYTYFWTFNVERALILLKKNIMSETSQLEHQLTSRELKRFYICKTCNIEITEENALINNFICPECGQVYELNDNKKAINEINNAINKLKKQLEDIDLELEVISGKKIKKMEKDKRKEEKDKKERRMKAAKKSKETKMRNKAKMNKSKKSKKSKIVKNKKSTKKKKA